VDGTQKEVLDDSEAVSRYTDTLHCMLANKPRLLQGTFTILW